jgi:uncharacterized protein (TIGR02266 family)
MATKTAKKTTKKASGTSKKSEGKKPAASADGTVENRKHPRVPLDVLVQVRVDTIEQFLQVHGKNLSVGGMFIQTTAAKPVGTQLYFQFTVKDGGTLIEGLGKVVHASPHGMGVEFVSVLEPSATIIRTLVGQRIEQRLG